VGFLEEAHLPLSSNYCGFWSLKRVLGGDAIYLEFKISPRGLER